MKILIVDDESIIRIGMRYVIPWEQYGFDVVGEASNGADALELSKIHKPDIVLTDIVMPEMDGLSFIEKIKKDLPNTKFIICSCHDDGDFYRRAIKLGVSEYIQKSHVSPQEILQIVERISAQILQEQEKWVNIQQDSDIKDKRDTEAKLQNYILKGGELSKGFEQSMTSLGLNVSGKNIYVMVLQADFPITAEKQYDGEYNSSILSISKSILDDMAEGYLFESTDGIIVAILLPNNTSKVNEFLSSIYIRINDTMNQMFDVRLTSGVSVIAENLSGTRGAYAQAVNALGEQYVHGLNKIYFYSEENNLAQALELISVENEKIHKILSVVGEEKIINCLANIETITSSYKNIKAPHLTPIYMDIIYHIINRLRNEGIKIEDIMGTDFNPIKFVEGPKTLGELNINIGYIASKIRQYYASQIKGREGAVISTINNYIHQHAEEKITLNDIAAFVHLSPGYTSRFYKKETNANIQNFIVSVKIEKSKELLRLGCSFSEVADRIGFASESHLFKLFKNYTGITPKRYKELIINGAAPK